MATASARSGPPINLEEVKDRIAAHPIEGEPAAMREAFDRLAGPQPTLDNHPAADALTVGDGPPLLFFHGGGYVFGSPESHAAMASEIAAHGVRVILPRYPLAPHAQWPAMLNAAETALQAVGGKPIVGGASAGGHLALNLALERPDAVSGLALLSPNTDRTGASGTRAALSPRDRMNDDEGDAALARQAFGDAAADRADVSPLTADLSALPPLLIEVGSEEVLLDDAVLLARRAILSGATASLTVTAGLFHLAALWPKALPDAAGQLARLAAFCRRTDGASPAQLNRSET